MACKKHKNIIHIVPAGHPSMKTRNMIQINQLPKYLRTYFMYLLKKQDIKQFYILNMRKAQKTRNDNYYLDVTQFIFTDHRQFVVPSPHYTPLHLQQPDVIQNQRRSQGNISEQCYLLDFLFINVLTPSNLPVIIEVEGVQLSPYFQVGQGNQVDIEFFDFTLEDISQEHEDSFDENLRQQQSNQCEENLQNQNKQQVKIEEEEINNQNTYNFAPEIASSQLNIRYFKDIFSKLKKNKATQAQLKEFLFDYLTDEDHDEINHQTSSLEDLEKIVKNNLRYVGPISWLERKYKVQKYNEKKKNRIWKKKISYDCRKRVADNRLRVKGKFVTKVQACNILGVEELEEQNIKQLLISKKTESSTK